jgi:hypothetical protein
MIYYEHIQMWFNLEQIAFLEKKKFFTEKPLGETTRKLCLAWTSTKLLNQSNLLFPKRERFAPLLVERRERLAPLLVPAASPVSRSSCPRV